MKKRNFDRGQIPAFKIPLPLQFSNSVVQQIVEEYLECRSPKYILKKYGIVKSTLYNWVRDAIL